MTNLPASPAALIAAQSVVDSATYVAQALTYQSSAALPADWAMILSSASFLDTPAMGTILTLGAPTAALETEYDGVTPVLADDGTLTCSGGTPTPADTATLHGSGTPSTSGTSWATATNITGASDTNRAVFTSATANAVGYIDIDIVTSSVPAGATVNNVKVTVDGFASSDTLMPYTAQPYSGATALSTAQSANSGAQLTFTGVTYANLTGFKIRVQGTHNNSSTSATMNLDSIAVIINYSPAPSYRSEAIFTSDRTDGASDYTIMRFVEGERIRVAFDVMTHGLASQDAGNWNSVFQTLGKAISNNSPFTPLSINIENGEWKVGGGNAITFSEITPRTTHQDGRWVRWELDILLGRAGVGSVSVWKDGEQLALGWLPTSGTYYAGNSNNAIDLQWLYVKCGLYGGCTTSPQTPKAVFRNRRFSITTVGGVTTTWRGPGSSTPGLKVYRRNTTTGMPY